MANARLFTRALSLPEPESCIVPLIMGDPDTALAASRSLADQGFLVTAIRPPTVPEGTARLRFTFTAEHKRGRHPPSHRRGAPAPARQRRGRVKRLFVTGSGTGVGKTLVTAALAHQLSRAGKTVRAVKPVISGYTPATHRDSDTAVLLDSLGSDHSPEAIDRMSPFRFEAPLSPDMAAAREGRQLDFEALLHFCRDCAAGPEDILLIEGVGGVMVPLTRDKTVLDWIEAIDAPCLLVAGSYLGTISHTSDGGRSAAPAPGADRRAGDQRIRRQPGAAGGNESDGSALSARRENRHRPAASRQRALARRAGPDALSRQLDQGATVPALAGAAAGSYMPTIFRARICSIRSAS